MKCLFTCISSIVSLWKKIYHNHKHNHLEMYTCIYVHTYIDSYIYKYAIYLWTLGLTKWWLYKNACRTIITFLSHIWLWLWYIIMRLFGAHDRQIKYLVSFTLCIANVTSLKQRRDCQQWRSSPGLFMVICYVIKRLFDACTCLASIKLKFSSLNNRGDKII